MSDRSVIVVCDDEELIRWSLATHLEQEGHTTIQAKDGEEALRLVREHAPSLVLLDLKMPEKDGLTVLRELRESGNDVPVVMITAHGGVDSAIEATRLGASDYIAKPFDLREITLIVEKALERDRLKNEVLHLRGRRRTGYGDFIGRANSLTKVFDTLQRLEKVDPPTVLILGESGTGKDVIAHAIHERGPRRDEVFMEVDCASLPEQLIQSELFGHERGSFTDARQTKRGLFEVAGRGIVFLDEIGEMSLNTQSKLLRAIESRTFKRVGGVANIPLRATIIAATNRDLKTEVDEGGFRQDLFYRLNVVPIQLPPLRERTEDIPDLVAHFLERFNRNFGRDVRGVSGEAMSLLQSYRWPGNVRELRNVVERATLLTRSDVLEVEDLPPEIRFAGNQRITRGTAGCPFTLPEEGVDLEAVERGLMGQALDRTGGNQSAAARLLGISRYALRYRMEKYGMLPGKGDDAADG